MIFRVLGPVELWIDGQRRNLGTPKERSVLAALLLTPGRTVPVETLIRCLWDERPPGKPRQSLYSYVVRLRTRLRELAGVGVPSRQGGYALDGVENEAVDLHRFRLLRDQARAIAGSGDEEYALERYREAARLWKGTPLADLSGEWVERTRRSLQEELLAATFERIDLELRRGHHADVVTELGDLAERHPFDPRPVERLMVALYRAGRQADALDAYRRHRDHQARELGTEPGPRLRELQRLILRNDPELARVPAQRLAFDRPPNNLPHDLRAFTGRDEELRHLWDAVPAADDPRPSGRPVMITIDGMAGVGKTALAVHLAHRLAGRFPDGRVWLNLHAHEQGQEPLDPVGALDILLRFVGVPATRIPRTLEERAALWRSRLAGTRMLLVLDDATGYEQVKPLLPASEGCLVVITSRRRLTGLLDAHPLSLDVLPVDEAVDLFTRIAGPARVAGDRAGVAAVVEQCGRLPLAVAMAASRLRHRRTWTVADLRARLGPEGRLEELRNEGGDIARVFEVSYRGLAPPLREAFRLLGLHPGPDLTAHAAAAALGRPVREAERILEELLDRHLIGEPVRGRYRFHVLVHDYARRLADGDGERHRAEQRIRDFYLAAADRADRLLTPPQDRPEINLTWPPPDLPPLRTAAEAEEWFAAELDCLVNVSRSAPPDRLARLSRVLAAYLENQGHWEIAADLHERALTACARLGDRRGEADTLTRLCRIRLRSTAYGGALEAAERALEIYQSLQDRRGEAEAFDHVSLVHWHRSSFAEALAHCEKALEIRRSLGDERGVARSLDHAAILSECLGRYTEAERLRDEALTLFQEVDDLPGRAMALNNMGDLAVRMGQEDLAVHYYQEAAAAVKGLGRQYQAIWLSNMANVDLRTGRREEALEGYRKALAVFSEIGDRRNEIEALLGIGRVFQAFESFGEALIHYQKAHTIARAVGGRYEEAMALRHMGEALLGAGRLSRAAEHLRQAHDLAARIGIPFETAKALEGLGKALLPLEGREAARRCWQRALGILNESGLPEERAVRSLLVSLGATDAPKSFH